MSTEQNENMKGYRLLYISSLLYGGFYFVSIMLGFTTGLSFTDIDVTNIFRFGILPIPFLPLIWLLRIKTKNKEVWAYRIYGLILIPVTIIVIILGVLLYNDLQLKNGFRRVYETKAQNGTSLVIFKNARRRRSQR